MPGIVFNILTIVILRNINKRNMVMNFIMTVIAVSDSIEIINYIMNDSLNGFFPDYEDQYQKFRLQNLIWYANHLDLFGQLYLLTINSRLHFGLKKERLQLISLQAQMINSLTKKIFQRTL